LCRDLKKLRKDASITFLKSKTEWNIHAIQFKDEDFELATATTTEEIKQLRQVGFVKYDELNGIHFYRKPKRFGGLQVK
jgi:hypothetical protein